MLFNSIMQLNYPITNEFHKCFCNALPAIHSLSCFAINFVLYPAVEYDILL